jgi:hypothetical protein
MRLAGNNVFLIPFNYTVCTVLSLKRSQLFAFLFGGEFITVMGKYFVLKIIINYFKPPRVSLLPIQVMFRGRTS